MNKERLLKIANHLSYGNLAHDVFSFITYNDSLGGRYKNNGCGTHGCAIGELPKIFPEDFAFVSGKYRNAPLLLESQDITEHDKIVSIRKYLDLNKNEYEMLFIPYKHKQIEAFNNKYKANLIKLDEDATRYEVSGNIRKFIKTKEKHNE